MMALNGPGRDKVIKMMHSERAFSFKRVENEEELIAAMFNYKWPLCYSFYYKNQLYLNDSDSEDSPEYAVVTIDKTEGRFGIHGREVGRLNPSVMPTSDAKKIIQNISAGNFADESPVQLTAEPKWHHCCALCGLNEGQ